MFYQQATVVSPPNCYKSKNKEYKWIYKVFYINKWLKWQFCLQRMKANIATIVLLIHMHTQSQFQHTPKIVPDFIVALATSSTIYSIVTDATPSYIRYTNSPLCPSRMMTRPFSYLRGMFHITPTLQNRSLVVS